VGLIKRIKDPVECPECVDQMVWMALDESQAERILAVVAEASAYENLPVLTSSAWTDRVRELVGTMAMPFVEATDRIQDAMARMPPAHPMTEDEAREAVLHEWLRTWERAIEAQHERQVASAEYERLRTCPVCQQPRSKMKYQETCETCALAELWLRAQDRLLMVRPDGSTVTNALRDRQASQ
jgi:hypothetical protein